MADKITVDDSKDAVPELAEFFPQLKNFTLKGVILLNDELGSGAYGTVFKVKYGEVVSAAKKIHPVLIENVMSEEKQRIKDNFIQECLCCSNIRHPNIVHFVGVYYRSNQSSLPIMVMELMDSNLSDFVKNNQFRITLETKVSILYDVSKGLDFLHNHKPKILHRDLSSNNVMLTKLPIIAKIGDLGVAKIVHTDSRKTKSNLTKAPGTPDFMPPEALQDEPDYDTPIDVFSFGGIALHVFSEEWPTPSASKKTDSAASKVVSLSEVERRQKYLNKITGKADVLKNTVEKCLSDNPKNRPSIQDVSEIIEPLTIPDARNYKVTYQTVNASKEFKLTITLKNSDNVSVINKSEKIIVTVFDKDMKSVHVKPITEVGDGIYETSFTVSTYGDYIAHITVDGHLIPGSPYKASIDRDYSDITEAHCNQVMTHYGEKKFDKLSDVEVGPNGEVIIVDSGNRCVVVLDKDLDLLAVIGKGSGKSKLVYPDGVAVANNIIAVTDYGSHQVKKYSLRGEFLSVIGCRGNKDGEFEKPRGLAFNKNKLLYVVDRLIGRVQVFQMDDTFAFSFGNKPGPGLLQWPIVIGIDPNNNTLVTDRDAYCIFQFSWLGNFIRKICCSKSVLYSFAVSPTGYLITGYYGDNNKIKVYDPNYKFLKEFGKKGSENGEFNGIMGIAVDPSGTVYVVEWDNKRLQIINKK